MRRQATVDDHRAMGEGNALRTALIGFGTGGSLFHAPFIAASEHLSLDAVVTSRADDVRARHPDAEVLDTADRVWENPDRYDLVVIAAPNRWHVPFARAAVTSGLPSVVDKPVATSADEARSLAALAAVRGVPVVPFHNRRWDGDFRTVSRLVADGVLGRVLRLESRFERWRPDVRDGWKESTDPRDAGGILYDLGPHLVDQAIALFGPPDTVYAEVDVRRPGARTPDDAFLALTHPNGVRSHLWVSATAADLGPRFRVLGDRAAYTIHGMDGQEEALRGGGAPTDAGWGQRSSDAHGHLGVPGKAAVEPTLPGFYQDFYTRIARMLRDGDPPPVDLADAVVGMEVLEAARRSAAERDVVVVER